MTLNQSSKGRTLPSRVAWCKGFIESSTYKGFDGRSHDHAYAHSYWRKMESSSSCDESAPPCEWSNHGYKLNSRPIDGTPWQVGMLNPPTRPRTKMLAPMSNLTWLRAAVRNSKSRAALREIWPWDEYHSYILLSQLSNRYLHALIRSTVWELWSFKVDGCWNSVLDKMEHSEQSGLWTIIQSNISGKLQYQHRS
jgi:hypothetical protein